MAPKASEAPRTRVHAAVGELRDAIISGEIQPGTPIRLEECVKRLAMSTVPIREALRVLEQRGLIELRPHRGAIVSDLSAADLEDTYSVRLSLESQAVRRAAERVTPEDRLALLSRVDEYATALRAGNEAATEEHFKLHMALYDLADSRWLRNLIPALWDNSERYRRLQQPSRGRIEDRINEHRDLVESCCSGDPDIAEQALRSHLGRTVETSVRLLKDQEVEGAAS